MKKAAFLTKEVEVEVGFTRVSYPISGEEEMG